MSNFPLLFYQMGIYACLPHSVRYSVSFYCWQCRERTNTGRMGEPHRDSYSVSYSATIKTVPSVKETFPLWPHLWVLAMISLIELAGDSGWIIGIPINKSLGKVWESFLLEILSVLLNLESLNLIPLEELGNLFFCCYNFLICKYWKVCFLRNDSK